MFRTRAAASDGSCLTKRGTGRSRNLTVRPTPEDQVEFLQNLQRLLSEGLFTATYKYALLLALADIAVEKAMIRVTHS